MKGYTTIEQSKKLLELGLDPKTADMHWWTTHDTYVGLGWSDEFRKKTGSACLPAWSLAALLELMPDHIDPYKNEELLDLEILKYYDGWHVWYISHSIFDDHTNFIYEDVGAIELIDGVFTMVCWLLKNKYIEPMNKE